MSHPTRIFLAHASEDTEQVIELYDRLAEQGYQSWLEVKELLAGQDWRVEIPKAIDNSEFLILCLSQTSVKKQRYREQKLLLALNQYAQKTLGTILLVPIKLDNCQVPDWELPQLGVNLQDIKWLNYWQADGFKQLVKAIENQKANVEAPSPVEKDELQESQVSEAQSPLPTNFSIESSQPTQSPKPPQSIPYQGATHFVGREEGLEILHQELTNTEELTVFALTGMAGVGKTELAIQYALRYRDDYPGGIYWLNVRDTDLAAEILQFAQLKMSLEIPQEFQGRRLSLPEQFEWFWDNWQPPQERVLIILDDVTELGNVRELLPKNNCFRILITTGLPPLDSDSIAQISLGVLSPENALQLLGKLLADGEVRIEQDKQKASDLCEWLGYLPLGLQLVGSYLAENPHLSLAQMLDSLKEQELYEKQLPDSKASDSNLNTARQRVKAAFKLSWEKLDTTTQHLGQLLSLFASNPFQWQWLQGATQILDYQRDRVDRAKKQLYRGHFIERVEQQQDSYKVHPLIREFLQEELAASEQAEQLKQAFTVSIAAIGKIPDNPTLQDIESGKNAIAHLQEVARNLTNAIADENLLELFTQIVHFYKEQRLYILARDWEKQCLSVVKERLGSEHPDYAICLNNLAYIYYFQGRYEQAEPLYLEAYELRKRILGEEDPHVANSLNNLAELYKNQGRYDQAEPLYLQAHEMYQRLLGKEHLHVTSCLNNLAELYHSQGNYEQAESLYLQAYEQYQRLLGKEHPYVASCLNNLAELYHSQGHYDQAEPLYQQVYELTKLILGEKHPSVVTSLNNLAGLYHSQGRYDRAEPLYLQAYELTKHILGEKHPKYANSLNNLAYIYHSQGRYQQAEPLYLQALDLYKYLLGEEHPSVGQTLNNLAQLYYSQGRYQQAEPLYLQTLEILEKTSRKDSPDFASTLDNLAQLYHSQGNYEQAKSLYLQAYERRKSILGEEHPDVAQSLNNLAGLYKSQGIYEQAEPLYRQALELYKRILGNNHPSVATSLNNLALLYHSQGSYRRAVPLYRKACELTKRILGENHPSVATSLNNLALLYHSQRRYQQAQPLYLEALKIAEKTLGHNHPKTIIFRQNLDLLRQEQETP